MPDVCEELKSYYTTWNGVIGASGINSDFFSSMLYKIEDLEPSYQDMLKVIKEQAYAIGRCPLHREIEDSVKKALIKRCGSWRNVLYQIDLKPIMRIAPFYDIYIDYRKTENRTSHTDSLYGCYYEILNLTENDKEMLSQVQDIYDKKGKPAYEKRCTERASAASSETPRLMGQCALSDRYFAGGLLRRKEKTSGKQKKISISISFGFLRAKKEEYYDKEKIRQF